jgi:hypothetical protein
MSADFSFGSFGSLNPSKGTKYDPHFHDVTITKIDPSIFKALEILKPSNDNYRLINTSGNPTGINSINDVAKIMESFQMKLTYETSYIMIENYNFELFNKISNDITQKIMNNEKYCKLAGTMTCKIAYDMSHVISDGYETFDFEIDGLIHKILVVIKQISNIYDHDSGGAPKQILLIADNLKIINSYIESKKNVASTKLGIYKFMNTHNSWLLNGYLDEKSFENLAIEKKILDSVIEDIELFESTENEEQYKKYQMPYKKNYLFNGYPGTGKTSFCKAIATFTKREIYMLTSESLDKKKIHEAINYMKRTDNKKILLIEDIDSLNLDRTNSNNENASLSEIMNILDGINTQHGLITIITSNDISKLDGALIRPGRIDMVIKFSYPSLEQIKNMLKFIIENLMMKQ